MTLAYDEFVAEKARFARFYGFDGDLAGSIAGDAK